MTPRSVQAPAKINLGLEILGKRDDGYHEIRTVLCTVSLSDTLTFEPATTPSDELLVRGGDLTVAPQDNLVVRALDTMRQAGAAIPPQRATLTKRIPTPSGLGGASSDAAATLIAFHEEVVTAAGDPLQMAAMLGSDVPFFLNGPAALASGRGERITPLPRPDSAWAVVVTPQVRLPAKTQALYGAVERSWWSDGAAVGEIAHALPRLPTEVPPNVFERAIVKRFPGMAAGRQHLRHAGADWAALSGAGPSYYTIVDDLGRAGAIASRITDPSIAVNVVRLGCKREPNGHA
jgi:4-diphosphocytidyl-2-C-methyl-D-erythritol kinase